MSPIGGPARWLIRKIRARCSDAADCRRRGGMKGSNRSLSIGGNDSPPASRAANLNAVTNRFSPPRLTNYTPCTEQSLRAAATELNRKNRIFRHYNGSPRLNAAGLRAERARL